MYHLAYAKIYTQTHRLTLTPYLRYPVSPQTNEMLFTLAFLLYDDVSAQLIQFLMMGVLGIGLFCFGAQAFFSTGGSLGGGHLSLKPDGALVRGKCLY
jgi:hypothetical protein